MDENVLYLRERPLIYQMFAEVFAVEPSAEFLDILDKTENRAIFSSYGVDPLGDIRRFTVEEQVNELAVEFAWLFLLPGTDASPRESIQAGEKRLWGDSTVKVNKIYKKFGFELDSDFKETPDHISAELTFLAKLSALELEYTEKGLSEAKDGVIEVKRYFLENHLLKWFTPFKDRIAESARLSYYRGISQVLDMFLKEERIG